MANYSLTVDNKRYDPTAWLSIVGENLAAAKQEHRAAEVAYGELASKADVYEKLAHDVQGTDSQAYQDYMNYANTLRQHTDMLATQGITSALWRNLLQAKNDYSRIIAPIEEAWNAREKEAERQAKYLEQHPTAIFEKDARDMGIDQWLKNPHYRAKSYDLEKVAERAKERYTALQKQVMQMVSMNNIDPMKMSVADIKKWVKVAGVPYLYESMETGGVNPEEVRKFMMGDKSTLGSILRPIAQETLGMYSTGDWNTDYDHYTAEQNQLRRDNMNRQMISTVVGEAPNSIGTTATKDHTDTVSIQWAQLAEQKRQFDINDKWRKDPNNPANRQSAGSGGGGSTKINPISITTKRDNYIDNGMTRDEANKAVILEHLPENLRNTGVLKILKAKGYDTKFLNGDLDFDENILKEIKNAYDKGEGDISYTTATWESFKNMSKYFGKAFYKGVGSTVKACLSPFVGAAGSLSNICQGVYHGLIKGDVPVGTAFDTDWSGYGSINGIGNFITSNDFLPGLGDGNTFVELDEQARKSYLIDLYTKMDDNGNSIPLLGSPFESPLEAFNKEAGTKFKTKHEVSDYLNNKYEIDSDAIKLLKETNEMVGYDPDDTRYNSDFVYSLGVSSILRNPEDYMVNSVTSAANSNWQIALNNFNQNAISGAYAFSNMDGSNLDDTALGKIQDAAKNNTLTAAVYTSADKKGNLKNEIVVLTGEKEDTEDVMYHSQLPRDARIVIQDNLDQSLRMNIIASDHKAYKNLSQSQKNAIKDNYITYYAHENGTDGNSVSLSAVASDVNAGAISLYNSLTKLNYIRRKYEELTNEEKEELTYKYMAQKLAGSFNNNAILAYFTALNSGYDQAGSVTGANYDKPIIKNDYINYQYR